MTDCPSYVPSEDFTPGACRVCGETGHWAKECPRRGGSGSSSRNSRDAPREAPRDGKFEPII